MNGWCAVLAATPSLVYVVHMTTVHDARNTVPARAGARQWVGLGVLGLASLLVSIDVFVLLLALPSLSRDLGASATEQLWIMDIYGFLLVGFMLTAGTLGDRVGRRRLLLLGGAAFAVASVVAAFSVSPEMLIAARAALGIAGATLAPSTLGLISTMFRDERQRGVAIGVWLMCFMGGAAVGPILGGLLLENFWWGAAFLLGVPAMALLLILGPILLPEERAEHPGRLDLASVALSLAAILPTVWGLKEIAAHGWAMLPIVAIAFGVAMGVVFVRRQLRLPDPLVDVTLFRDGHFTTAIVAMMLITVLGSLMFFSAQYIQLVAGVPPFEAGLLMIPSAATALVGFGLAPVLAQRMRPAPLIAVGMVVAAIGSALYIVVPVEDGTWAVVTGLALMNLGSGPMVTLGTGIVVGSVPSAKAGSAASMSETSAEFGYAMGLALLGSLAAVVYRASVVLPPGTPDAVGTRARESLAGAVEAAADGADAGVMLAAREAFVSAVHVVGWVTALTALLIGALALVFFRRLPPVGQDAAPAAH